ncbi:MAG: transposase [Firmicutes bacterium]|nr:transposase [Bacillota bacterium]
MFRGNELKNIFFDVEDRLKFLQLLDEKALDENFTVYAYCLMDNHVHILLYGEHENLSRLVKRINTSYVYYFNKKQSRVGHLFHDRFKSQPVETDAYLLAVVRYIHNNPVKAGMVADPLDYRWSSYRSYADYPRISYSCLDPLYILKMFSENISEAKKLFLNFSKQQEEKNLKIIDIDENEMRSKDIIGEAAAKSFVDKYLQMKGIQYDCLRENRYKSIRNELISELRKKSNLSIRQIASLFGVSRGVVSRIRKV